MPHVSSNKLDDKHIKALYNEFIHAFEKCFKDKRSLAVLNQFLTRTEREMFAKRLGVIAMLSKNISRSIISKTLKMSPVTVDTMQARYEAGRYDWVIKSALRDKGIWNILDDIGENLNTAGGLMPPYVGRGRRKNS